MQNIDLIQKSLDYIEDNLQAEFCAEELADMAGYSLFHFYRVFQNAVGIPLMQYITRRKLLHAAFDIAKGMKVIDAALLYGFATNAGFYKAFLHEFQLSPSEYVARHEVKRPYKINLIQEEHIMLSYKKIKEILPVWNMQDEVITDFYYEGTGNRSDCQWNIGEQHVLKVGTNVVGLEQHIKISHELDNLGLQVSLPIKTLEGNEYYWDGELYYCIETKLEGTPIKSESFYEEKPKFSARYMGEILGQIDISLNKFSTEFVCNEPNLSESVVNWAIPKVKNVTTLKEDFFEDFERAFPPLYDKLPKQLIHRNPCPNNFVGDSQNIVGITDFELSEKNIRIYDACYITTSILSENFKKDYLKKDKWFDIFRDIMYGYDSVIKLTDEEKKAIPYVIYSIQFTCIAYFSDFDKYKELTEINVAMLEWLVNNHEKLEVW